MICLSKMKTKLSEIELEFISNAAIAFDGMIAEKNASLDQIAEISRFLIGLYGKSKQLSETDRKVFRDAYMKLS